MNDKIGCWRVDLIFFNQAGEILYLEREYFAKPESAEKFFKDTNASELFMVAQPPVSTLIDKENEWRIRHD